MFDIEYKGGNGIVISTKKTRLVVDPKISVAGYKDVAVKDSIELATEPRFAVDDETALLSIEGPGEYEVADFSIRGIAARRHIDSEEQGKAGTIYRIEVSDIRIGLLGNIAPTLNETQLEGLGIVDILILPVGGNGYTLDATAAAHLVRAIDAKAIIPIHYADTTAKYEVPQDGLEIFKKELGSEVEQTAKLKVKSASTLPAVTTIIELDRS